MTSLRKYVCTVALGLGCLTLGTSASAQTPTIPVPLKSGCPLFNLPGANAAPAALTKALTEAYQGGDWMAFKGLVESIRKSIAAATNCDDASADSDKSVPLPSDYFVVAWVGTDPFGDAALLSAVVHNGAGEKYVSRLPGLKANGTSKLYQIFVSDGPGDSLATSYLSTRQENPLLAQVPDVAARLFEPFLALASSTAGTMSIQTAGAPTPAAAAAPPKPSGWASLARVDLPFERASVKVAMKATLPATTQTVQKTSAALKARLTYREVPHHKKATDLAASLDQAVRAATTCLIGRPTPACLAQLDMAFKAKYDGTCAGCSEDTEKAVKLVDAEFRKLLPGVAEENLDGALDLVNIPLTRHSFGLTSGFLFHARSKSPRVTIADDTFASDPLERPMTMVIFNTSLKPYDADAFTMTDAEKTRWFVGAVLTPTFGVSVGFSYVPLRGVGVNIGYAALGINTAAGGKAIGDAPASAKDPFKLGVVGAFFAGLSYNFK